MKTTLLILAALLGTIILLSGCGEDEDDDDIISILEQDEFVLATMVGETTFVSAMSSLDQGTATNEKAFESVNTPAIFVYKDMVFVTESTYGDTIDRYDRSSNGELIPAGSLVMPSGSAPVKMAFVSPTKAYVCNYQTGKLGIINPTEMTLTKEIDLMPYAVEDNNPDPYDMAIRDDKLYVALRQATSIFSVDPNASVLILDIATDTVDKVITDDRVGGIGIYVGFSGGMIMDEVGDLYIYSTAVMGYQPDIKDGFLRIRKGETEFDPDYLFRISETNIADVPGNFGNYQFGMVYIGDGVGYGFVNIPAMMSDPPDYINDRSLLPCKINLVEKTVEKIGLNPTPGFVHFVSRYEDKILFALAAVNGDGIYTYDLNTGEISNEPIVKTEGMPYYIKPF